MFSGGIKREQWHEMGWNENKEILFHFEQESSSYIELEE